jgi:predicted dehydrogenase
MESAERIVNAAKTAKGFFMMAQVLRFWPEFTKTKQFIDDGTLGKVSCLIATHLTQFPNWAPWFRDPVKSGGALFDLMMHNVDYANYLLGCAKSAYAVGQKDDHGAWNEVTASFEFPCGANAVIESKNNMINGYPFSMDLRVMGDKGTADFKFSAGFNIENLDSAIDSFVLYTDKDDPAPVVIEHPDAYELELRYFIECVEKGEKPAVITPDSSYDSMRMIDAVRRSLESGEKIIL